VSRRVPASAPLPRTEQQQQRNRTRRHTIISTSCGPLFAGDLLGHALHLGEVMPCNSEPVASTPSVLADVFERCVERADPMRTPIRWDAARSP